MGWNAVDDEILGIRMPSETQEIGGGVRDDAALKSRFAKARAKSKESRGLWDHFMDTIGEGMIHSGLGVEPVYRAYRTFKYGQSQDRINKDEKKIIEGQEQRRAVRDLQFEDVDTFSPANIGRRAVDVVGNLIGGVDPTYPLAPGGGPLGRVLGQAAINSGVDAFSQGAEVARGIKDKFNVPQNVIAGAGGAALQGAGEVIARGAKNLDMDTAKGVGSKFGTVTSTYRTPAHNKKVGGAKNSWHTKNRAIDIARKKGVSHKQIENAYRRAGFDIIESLDEGDHSHLAFRFKRSKEEIADIEARGRKMAGMNEQELEAQFAKDQATLDGIASEGREALLRASDPANFREGGPEGVDASDVNSGFVEPTVPVPPHLRAVISAEEWNDMPEGMRQQEALKAKQQEILKQQAFEAMTPAQKKMTQINQDFYDGKLTGDEYYQAIEDFKSGKFDDVEFPSEYLNPTRPALEDPKITPKADLTPRDTPPARPAFPGEEGFPEPGTPGNMGGPKGGPDPVAPTGLEAFTAALKASKKANPQQAKLRRAARKEKMSELMQRRNYTSGEEGLHVEKGALKGELPKIDIEPIRDKLDPEDIRGILDGIKNSKRLRPLESIVARDALVGLLDGKLPTKGELELLYRVHPEIVQEVLNKRPISDKIKDFMLRAYETSRGQMGSGDVSFGGRQGIMMISRPQWWKATWDQFKALSPSQGDEVLGEQLERIVQHPHYDRAKQAGLKHMDLGGHGSREEFAAHSLAESIPVLGEIPKASNRAYTFMGNELRYSTFYNIVDKAERAGVDIDDPQWLKALGDYINTFTGRVAFGKGKVGNALEAAMPAANLVLFAPRFVASTFQRLNPALWARSAVADYKAGSPVILKEMLRDTGAYVGMVYGLLQLANQAGYEVDWDPRSPTGLKIKHGKTTYDIGGGMVQTVNFLSKMATGTKISGTGNEGDLKDAKYGEDTHWSTLARFVRTKLHPTLAYLVNLKEGENVVGEKFDFVRDTLEGVAPMYANTVIEHIKEHGPDGVFALIPALFGMGLSTFDPEKIGEPKAPKEEFKESAPDESDEFDVTQWEFD